MNHKNITLTEKELEIIECWYNSAAGESVSGCSVPLRKHVTTQEYFDRCFQDAVETKALLDKLGFKYDSGDVYAMKGVGLLPAQYE